LKFEKEYFGILKCEFSTQTASFERPNYKNYNSYNNYNDGIAYDDGIAYNDYL
jgi:hypothetical protein